MMYRLWMEAVVCRWWKIGLMGVLCLAGWTGWAQADASGLSLEARVACQRAIEEVYWRHTIWPKENPSPKPQLSEVISEEELKKKVEETLRMSKALEEIWHHPVRGNDLQAEVERMAETTRDPEMLRELWSALGNDPQLIAECLARQTLVERLVHDWYAFDERFHGGLKKRAMRKVEQQGKGEDMKGLGGEYHEMEWRKGRNQEEKAAKNGSGNVLELPDDEWQEETERLSGVFGVKEQDIPLRRASELQEDAERFYVMEVLRKGTDRVRVAVVEWKKRGFDTWWARADEQFAPDVEGEAFTYRLPEITANALPPVMTIDWSATYVGIDAAPSPRWYHTAVWTGAAMVVWGGANGSGPFKTGGRYYPATNTWKQTNTNGAPDPREEGHTAVWTGTEMIVWGGVNLQLGTYFNTGGRYNPTTNTWTPTSTGAGVPSVRQSHAAVWADKEMIVWGGSNNDTTGGRYDPVQDKWTSTNPAGAPSPRVLPRAVWTGTEMIVWGGYDKTNAIPVNTGGRYNPAGQGTWTPTNLVGAPSIRYEHTAV